MMVPNDDKKTFDSHDLAEYEKNVATRLKVEMVWEELKGLKKALTDHMAQEDLERKRLDRKLVMLFILAASNMVLTGGGDVVITLFKLIFGG